MRPRRTPLTRPLRPASVKPDPAGNRAQRRAAGSSVDIEAHAAANHPGVDCRAGSVKRCSERLAGMNLPLRPPYTREQAEALMLNGHNLRCNRCGSFGATWTDTPERPRWGSLALCPPHKQELADEHARHAAALTVLRQVNFEQPLLDRPAQSGEITWRAW